MAHHRDFDHIDRYDRGLLGYNLLFLLFIGLLPFSTAAIRPISLRTGVYPFYWAIYAFDIILAGIMLTLNWSYATSHGLVKPETPTRLIRHHRRAPGCYPGDIFRLYHCTISLPEKTPRALCASGNPTCALVRRSTVCRRPRKRDNCPCWFSEFALALRNCRPLARGHWPCNLGHEPMTKDIGRRSSFGKEKQYLDRRHIQAENRGGGLSIR